MWETANGGMVVRVKWFYHPEETQGCPNLKYPVRFLTKVLSKVSLTNIFSHITGRAVWIAARRRERRADHFSQVRGAWARPLREEVRRRAEAIWIDLRQQWHLLLGRSLRSHTLSHQDAAGDPGAARESKVGLTQAIQQVKLRKAFRTNVIENLFFVSERKSNPQETTLKSRSVRCEKKNWSESHSDRI